MPSGRRTALGLDRNRINLLTAVLERRVGLAFADHDLYLSVVGGARLSEPAADLALAAAMVSSFRNLPIEPKTVCFGEIGLAGELRPVHATESRLKEAAKLGFHHAVIPHASEKLTVDGMRITPCKSLSAPSMPCLAKAPSGRWVALSAVLETRQRRNDLLIVGGDAVVDQPAGDVPAALLTLTHDHRRRKARGMLISASIIELFRVSRLIISTV